MISARLYVFYYFTNLCYYVPVPKKEVVHLSGKAQLPAASLPYGQQRKLEIAKALATDMKVLLPDEPAAGMNPTETAELLDCISTIRSTLGIAILRA